MYAHPEFKHTSHPPVERLRLYPNATAQRCAETVYENTSAQDNARVHYGHVFNYTASTNHPTMPHMPAPMYDDRQRAMLDPVSLSKALRFDHMNTHLTSMRAAYAGTCEWLLEKEEYKTWRANCGFLWIKGKPGTGKSTIMNFAYNHGAKAFTEDVSLSYFFSARSSKLQCSTEGLYRSLLHQLIEIYPALSESLEKHGLHPNDDQKMWHKERLEVLLHEAVLASPTKQLTCYVDAIDECGYSEAQEIMEFLGRLSEAREKENLKMHVLVSSRHYPHVIFNDCQQITLEDQDEHKADISLYIRHKLHIGNSSQASTIRKTIQERACGVFLWVVMIVQILNEDKARGKVHLLNSHLNALPGGLHELFGNIVGDELNNDRILQLTFQWLLFAYRPLRLEELYFALMANELPDNIGEWKQDEVTVTDMANFILNSSRGLVEIARSATPTVQFIHKSVRDYLLKAWLPTFGVDPGTDPVALCHDQLRQCCQQYLLSVVPVLLRSSNAGRRRHMSRCFRQTLDLRTRAMHSYPFLEYALDGILSHANSSQSLGLQQREFVSRFPVESWVRLHNILVVDPKDRIGEEVDCKYLFVLKNALDLTRLSLEQEPLLARGCYDLTGGKYPSLLGAAVANGYHAMAELLLERDADPNSPASGTLSCLDEAVVHGNVDMVRTLLNHNATLQRSKNDPQKTQLSALRRAAELGMTEIVGILLAHPTYAEQWHPDMDCVLEAAIYKSNGPMIQLLNDRMGSEKRDVVRIMHAGNDLSAVKFDQEDSVFEALDSFRTYYRFRDRREPALLETIQWLYKDHLEAPFRMRKAIAHEQTIHRTMSKGLKLLSLLEISHPNPPALRKTSRALRRSLSTRTAVNMDTISRVLSLLQSYASTLREPMQITNHATVLEDASVRWLMVNLVPRDDRIVFFDCEKRVSHNLPGYAHLIPGGVCFCDGDCGLKVKPFFLLAPSAPSTGVAQPQSPIILSIKAFSCSGHVRVLLVDCDLSTVFEIELAGDWEHQVLALLKCQSSQSPVSMPAPMQMDRRRIVLEATESTMCDVDFDWDRFMDHVVRAYCDHTNFINIQANGLKNYSIEVRGNNFFYRYSVDTHSGQRFIQGTITGSSFRNMMEIKRLIVVKYS